MGQTSCSICTRVIRSVIDTNPFHPPPPLCVHDLLHPPPPLCVHGSLQIMQGVLVATCTLFGVLWLRAVARVRRSVACRSAMVQRLAEVTVCLGPQGMAPVTQGIVVLQAHVRRRQASVMVARMVAMDAYEASTPYRNHMLWLLNMVVTLYLGCCLYIIALYGEFEGGQCALWRRSY